MSSTVKTPSGKPLSLVWLRRDLRLYDHAAFAAAAKNPAPAQPVFVFDSGILARFRHKDDRRLTFIAEALCRMHEQLQKKGGGLLVCHGHPEKLIPELCEAAGATHLYAAEDFEPATRERDEKVAAALKGKVEFSLHLDHLLFSPRDVLKSDGEPFKVFTPYSRVWQEAARKDKRFAAECELKGLTCADYQECFQLSKSLKPIDPGQGVEALLKDIGYEPQKHDWPVDQARRRLHAFAERPIDAYDTARNFPATHGASRLSPYLRHGILSIRECARLAFEAEARGSRGASTWLRELIWRDFYAMILYHFPNTATEEMQAQYRKLPWNHDQAFFKRFAEGKTGYPIVDAAMRELLATGYMHNRARMIVASFMTKDLLLDWRLGEEHFAQHLMDYELSSNVGGWQWAASTGTDAQPYFRVFNPLLQSRKFDPEGEYIRRFVPELAEVDGDAIHAPSGEDRPKSYPEPIVEHMAAKEKAIAVFKKASAA